MAIKVLSIILAHIRHGLTAIWSRIANPPYRLEDVDVICLNGRYQSIKFSLKHPIYALYESSVIASFMRVIFTYISVLFDDGSQTTGLNDDIPSHTDENGRIVDLSKFSAYESSGIDSSVKSKSPSNRSVSNVITNLPKINDIPRNQPSNPPSKLSLYINVYLYVYVAVLIRLLWSYQISTNKLFALKIKLLLFSSGLYLYLIACDYIHNSEDKSKTTPTNSANNSSRNVSVESNSINQTADSDTKSAGTEEEGKNPQSRLHKLSLSACEISMGGIKANSIASLTPSGFDIVGPGAIYGIYDKKVLEVYEAERKERNQLALTRYADFEICIKAKQQDGETAEEL